MADEGWKPCRLSEIVCIKHGWPFKSKLFSEDLTGRPIVVNIGNFQYTGGFRFETTTIKEYRGDYPVEYDLKPGEILLVMTCQTPGGEILGIPARIPNDGRTYLHNQRLGKVVVSRPDKVDDSFLYWLFLWRDFNSELVATATGTKILHTAPSRIEAFRFHLPPLPEQRNIAHILGTLDDKIELNRRMNETLEAMARAIFKSWFVDFDPVRAKTEGRQPVGMDAAIAALFPDSFQDSRLGKIPKGWKLGKVSELISLSRDGINPTDFPAEIFDHHSIPAFDEGRLPKAEAGETIKSNKLIVPEGAVLLSKLNPRIPRIWLPASSKQRRAVCSTEFLVVIPINGTRREFVYALFGSQTFSEVFATMVTGTSGSHQRVKPESLLGMDTVILPTNLKDAFADYARIMLSKIAHNLEQSRTLTAIRDALLPKLISGELQVEDAKRFLTERGS